MTVKRGRKPLAEYRVKADCGGEVIRGAVPPVNLEPFRLVRYTTGDYRIRNGFPVATPTYDLRTAVSMTGGGVVTSDRPAPEEVETNATSRWIAGINWSGGVWTPAQGVSSNTLTTPGAAPVLEPDVDYRRGREALLRDALQFDPDLDQYLRSSGWPTGETEYSLIFVMALSEAFNTTDDDAVDDEFSGLVAPVGAADGSWRPSLHVRNGNFAIQTSPEKNFDTAPRKVGAFKFKSLAIPFYLSWAVGKPGCRIWMGTGPKNLVGYRVEYPFTDNPQGSQIYIGNSLENDGHTMNMTLFDVSYYDRRIDRYEVAREVKKLAKTYGGK